VTAYLTKPIRQSELRQALLMALGQKSSDMAAVERFPTQSCGASQSCLRVLLAEDNMVNQRLAMRLLQKHGHHVTVVGNGLEALTALAEYAFDLVLMDVQMPEMDGFEATRLIRISEQQRGGRTPIIAMTAHAMKGDRERCLAAGMDDYLTKPIHMEELFDAIARCLP
jgi:two-component system sensor histidine kinase/response regulator